MMRRRLARTVLAVDGMGCAAAAATVIGNDRVARSFDPSLRVRWPVAIALATTSAVLGAAAVRRVPENRDLERAAAVNAGWVATCLMGLLSRPSRPGIVIVAGTATLDAAAAIAQLALRSEADERHGDLDTATTQ